MRFPSDLLYAETHEWVREEGGHAFIGLTDYAQTQLRDVGYVELPKIGAEFKKGEGMGVVESVKTVADIFSPISGKVAETNLTLKNSPQWVNEDPYGKGWIVKMEVQDREELRGLLSSEAYEASLPEEM
jgi:glycine cleavage system H protein